MVGVPTDFTDATESTPEGLEIRHLRAFVAVAEELNFGRAAARLFVSQSSLSRQIAALERMLGCVLIHRSTHHVALTLAGKTMLDRAPGLLAAIDDTVQATRSVGGELAARIARLGEPFAELTYADVEQLRAMAERHYAQLPLANGIDYQPVNAHGVPGLISAPSIPTATTLLLLHGGTYTSGSSYGFRSLAGAVADATGGRVLTPDYRLAPEHTYPAAAEDAEHAYAWLLEQGTPPGDVVIVGDCSGAGHALTVLLRLRDRGVPLPGCGVFFTPWVDYACAAPERLPETPAQCATRAGASYGLTAYLDGHPLDDPIVAPLLADLTGLPPMLIQAAAGDEGVGDAERLADHPLAHGIDVQLETYPVEAQSFQLDWSFLPEAAEALRQVASFVTAH
jgi:epsilon-lactone hydrolase